jgi:hypothetical protein
MGFATPAGPSAELPAWPTPPGPGGFRQTGRNHSSSRPGVPPGPDAPAARTGRRGRQSRCVLTATSTRAHSSGGRKPSTRSTRTGRSLARLEWELADDRHDDQRRLVPRQMVDELKLERARILLDYFAAVKQAEKAAEVEADLATLEPAQPFVRQEVLEESARDLVCALPHGAPRLPEALRQTEGPDRRGGAELQRRR